MNVIISQDKSVRFTQESSSAYNLQDISFYISKQIDTKNGKLILQKDELFNQYEFNLIEKPNLSVNYNVYIVDLSISINLSAGIYSRAIVKLDTNNIELLELNLAAIPLSHKEIASTTSDQHEPIVITENANNITTIMNSDIYNADTNDAANEVIIGGGANSVKE